jgi:hypothetical protein
MYWQRNCQETQAKWSLFHMNENVTRKISGNKSSTIVIHPHLTLTERKEIALNPT